MGSKKDLKGRLEGLFSESAPEPETGEEAEERTQPLPEEILADLLRSETAAWVAKAESVTAEPDVATLFAVEPGVIEPVAAEPVAVEPAVAEPVAAEPITVEPAVAEPVVAEPVAAEPITVEPTVAEPIAAEPVVTKPVVAEPITAEPAVTEPVIAELFAAEPITVEPAVAEPVAAEPVVAKPVVAEPITVEPAMTEPVIAELFAAEPVAAEPAVVEPVITEPVAAEPVVTKPVVAEPITVKPAVTEPVTIEPAMIEPIAAKPTAVEEAPPPVLAEPEEAETEGPEIALPSAPAWDAMVGEQRRRIVNIMLGSLAAIATVVVAFLLMNLARDPGRWWLVYAPYLVAYVVLVVLALSRRLNTTVRTSCLVAVAYVAGINALYQRGTASAGGLYLIAAPLLLSLLVKQSAGAVAAGVSSALYAGFVLAEYYGLTKPIGPPDNQNDIFMLIGTFPMITAAVLFAQWVINSFLTAALREAEKQQTKALRSQTLLGKRADELAAANTLLQRRTLQLQTAAQISQATAEVLDPDDLVQQVVNLIRERLDLSQASLFRIDESEQRAVLAASTGEVGHQMLRRGYWVEVGGTSAVGWCTANAQVSISMDVSEEDTRSDDLLLPETRSNIALPLLSHGRVIGALDVQATKREAFSQEEIALLQTIADQLAVAIDNAQLFAETQARLEELEAVQRTYVRDQWSKFMRTQATPLYERTRPDVIPLADTAPLGGFGELGRAIEQAMTQQEVVVQSEMGDGAEQAALVAPLRLRGEIIGTLGLHETERGRRWTDDEVALIDTIATQMALAVENARLFEEAQQRAGEQEELARIAALAGSTLDLDELLARLVEGAVQLLGAQVGVLLLLDEDEKALVDRYLSREGRLRLTPGEWRVPLDTPGFEQSIFSRGGTYYTNRAQTDPNILPAYRPLVEALGAESFCGVALRMRDRSIGELYVVDRPGGFGPEQAQLLGTVTGHVVSAIENARLFEEANTRADELAILNDLAQAFTAATSVEEVVEEAYRGASRLLRTHNFYVGLYDPEKFEIEFIFDVSESEEDKQITTIPADQGLTGYVVQNRTSVLIGENMSEWLEERGVESIGGDSLSWLGVPLLIGDQVLGVMVVQSYQVPNAYGERDRDMLTAIASQTAIALQNANLFEETQRRATQLAASAEVARDTIAILDVNQLLDETVHLISEQFGFYHAGVFLVDEQDEWAVLRAASSAGGQRMLERNHRLKIGEVGIVGYVAATGEPRIALDVGKDAMHFANPDLPNTHSEMGLPLRARERIIGVLDVQSTKKAAFSEDDVAVLQTLADQLATAIENANLFQRVREDANRRALINEVNQAAASSLEIKELLGRAGEAISRQLEMPCVIFEWDAATETLKPVTIRDSATTDVTPLEPAPITAEMDPTMFHAIRTRQLQVLSDVTANVRGAAAQLARQLDLLDAAYIPLMSREQILGLLALGRHRGHPALDEGELSFLEVIATNLGVALENAQLYQGAVETAERLAEVDRLKTQFLANMSHELRTPLNSIIGFSRVILKEIDGPLTDMQRTDLQTIYDSGQHLLALINNLLEVAKIEAGKMEIVFEDVDLQPIIASVMSTAIALVKDKLVNLQQSIPEDLPIVRGDARRIRQVLINLVGNAAKFTEEGFVRVKAEVNPTEVTISVADSGIGVPEDKLETIFEAFTQVDSSSTRRAGGTGLGLSICRSYIEMHGGRLWVESTVDVGSTFYFTLPIEGPPLPEKEQEEEAEEVPAPEEIPVEERPAEEASRLVLCVEDDEGVITLFRRYLGKQGYQVVGLTDPTRVVEEAKRIRPYAITLDVVMPARDGWQVIQELKDDAETRHIPVIMCTIVAEKGHGISLGAADYLVKPIIEQDLLAALDRLDREAGRHLVLLVDDQAEHRALLRRMIENQDGYEIMEASGGQEAIAMLRSIRPQILLLDLMMPGMDGFAVLEAVKADEKTRSIPIIVVTAKELTDEDRQRLNHNIEALIQKGVLGEKELLEDVAVALRRLGRHMPQ